MIIDFLLGMSVIIIYKSYFELKELNPPEIFFVDNKGFAEIKYIEKSITTLDIIKYILNNNVIKLI